MKLNNVLRCLLGDPRAQAGIAIDELIIAIYSKHLGHWYPGLGVSTV